jgi:DnaK suppressor protein
MSEQIDLKKFRSLLEKRRQEIIDRRDSREEAAAPVELDQSKVGRVSRMDALQQQAMAKATDERTKLELVRIESALRRMDEGGYGHCLRCGEEISAGRLRVDPGATICIGCAEESE